jgi:NAD(P)-dependent dehydrogenase (short-subunit alcohol dehydrogenase family)
MQIADHAFLVTGGCSGLGFATASALISGGAKVALLDIDQAKGAEVADALGKNAVFIRTDITSAVAAEAAVSSARSVFGGIRGLINCAGVAPAARIVGRDGPMPLERFSRVIELNLIGTFNMMRVAAAAIATEAPLEDGERGVIVNTASIAAWDGQTGQSAYASSKGGVASLTLPAAREFARSGIRVMCIAPGVFETPMMAGMPDDVREGLAANVPFPRRLGRPPEFAALVCHILGNPFLNGETIRLDGGLRMG